MQAFEAWARYDTALLACARGNVLRLRINGLTAADPTERIPLVNCNAAIPKPTVPRPKEPA